MEKALIVVDMQVDFVTGSLGGAEAQAIVPRVRQKLAEARAAGHTVVFTRDTHPKGYLNTFEGRHLPVEHCIEGTPGHAIIAELEPKAGELVVDKPTFGSLELANRLKGMVGEEAVLELCGLCTDICVVSNALLLRAHFPENEIVVEAAACAGVTPESHAAALATMRACQITIL